MVRGKPISLPVYTAIFVAALGLALLSISLVSSPVTHAGGIIGTGSDGGGGGGNYPYSYYGHGWYVFNVGHHGNNRPGIGSSNGWNNISDRCKNAGAGQVVVYLFERSSGGPGNGGIYNYHPRYDTYSAKHTSPYRWITTANARNRFFSPQLNGKRGGYSFGTNVGWFCYDFTPPNHAPTGNIQNIACRQSDGALRVKVSFNDQDGRSRAALTYAEGSSAGNPGRWGSTGGGTSPNPPGPATGWRWRNGSWWDNGRTFIVPGNKVYNNSNKYVRLYVQDRKPGGGWGGWDKVDTKGVSSFGALPCAPNSPPNGSLSNLSCTISGRLRVQASWNDPNGGSPRAYITYAAYSGSGTPGKYQSGNHAPSNPVFYVPAAYVYPTTSKTIRLYVQDLLGNGSSNGFKYVDSISTGSVLPCRPDTLPTGSLSNLSCDPSTGQLTVRASWNDIDSGSARAYITYAEGSPSGTPGKYQSGSHSSSNPIFTIPASYVFPYSSKWIRLYVQDILPNGTSNGYQYITYVSTASVLPCPSTVSCGAGSITPVGNIDRFTPFSITVSVSVSTSVEPPPTNSLTLQVTDADTGAVFYQQTATPSFNSSNGKIYYTFSNLGGVASGIQNGQYNYKWSYTNSTFPALNQNCGPKSFWVANMPFLQVYGGDVVAGGYAQDGQLNCQIDPNAGVYSWNRNGDPDWAGAGGEIAVIAMNYIQGFVSRLTTGSSNPSQLSFANTAYVNNSGDYGGKFGAVPGDCGYVGDAAAVGVDPGDVIGETDINVGGTKTYYVTGHNVYISSDVTYNGATSGAWHNAADVPSFKLVVVGGNIYVGSGVSELDGLYVAIPDSSGNGGQIVTCAYDSGGSFQAYDPGDDMYDNCNSQLKVWGTFAAKNVEFNRTYSTIGAAVANPSYNSSQASEVFIYSPEMWIPNGSGDNSFKYDSIVSLPPVL